jgi:tetratricopeptide (TPR) repeat protein
LWPKITLLASLITIISLAFISFNDSRNNASTGNLTGNVTQPLGFEYILRGNQLSNEGRYEEALAAYELSIDIAPEAVGYLSKGEALYELGRNEQALTAFDTAISMDPTIAHAHYMKGVVLYELARYGDALLEYDKALLIDPSYAPYYIEKAWALASLGRDDEAVTASNKAVILDPSTDSYWAKAGILNMTGRTEEALAAMDQFHQLNKTR